jgi:hypothetical protein
MNVLRSYSTAHSKQTSRHGNKNKTKEKLGCVLLKVYDASKLFMYNIGDFPDSAAQEVKDQDRGYLASVGI